MSPVSPRLTTMSVLVMDEGSMTLWPLSHLSQSADLGLLGIKVGLPADSLQSLATMM